MTPTTREVVGQLGGPVDPQHPGAAGGDGGALQGQVLEELALPMTTMVSQRPAMALRAVWRLVVAKHRSLRPGTHRSGQRAGPRPGCCLPLVDGQGGLGQEGHRARRARAASSTSATLDPVDGVGGDRHGADASSWPSWPT
jgi:hypothetical protein